MSGVAELLSAEANDYRTRAIAAEDQYDEESARAFKIVAIVLYEVAETIDQLEAA